jgi:hypothetical protein
MKQLKNIIIGFLISFFGSLPLGYLNIVGLQIFQKSGLESVIYYIFGILSLEIFVIYFTLIFAKRLVANKKLMKYLEIFSIFFLFFLAFIFYFQSVESKTTPDFLDQYLEYSAFSIGFIGNCFNFMQLLFWTSWNLYLINNQYIYIHKKLKFWYLFGTILGIFFGILTFIFSVNQLSSNFEKKSTIILSIFIPLFFLVIAFFQTFRFYKKYFFKSL